MTGEAHPCCPKCRGVSGKIRSETVRRHRFENWGGGGEDTDAEILIEESRWRCQDCNAYKIDANATATG